MNFVPSTIWTGDNLYVMRGMDSESVDLIYLDPPFNSKADYAAPIGSKAAGAAFKDTWTLEDLDAEWINLLEVGEPRLYRVLMAAMTPSDKSYLAYMAIRLREMKRLLKPAGSIYLHCDPTMSHYLKLVMDAVFGKQGFRNHVVWQRYGSHNDAVTRFGRCSDHLLYYAGEGATWNPQYRPLDPEYVRTAYRNEDAKGKYTTSPLHARTLTGGGYDFTWHNISTCWKFPLDRLEQLEADGLIHWPENGSVPRRKVYLKDSKGVPVSDVITDVKIAAGDERVGYPTQKPLALLDRIIRASSNPGDMVLDPFCGCATTCVSAYALGRKWAGIDISPKAAELVVQRITDYQGSLFRDCVHRRDVPSRTDLGDLPRYNCQENREALYGRQAGNCGGCGDHFKLHHLETDHIIAVSKGGTDHLSNLQLLCGNCNRIKGNRGMEYLRVKLQLAA